MAIRNRKKRATFLPSKELSPLSKQTGWVFRLAMILDLADRLDFDQEVK
jgi:hypothetical protein